MAATNVGHGVFDGTEMNQRGRGRRWGRCPVPFGVGLHSYGRTSSASSGDKCFSRPTAHDTTDSKYLRSHCTNAYRLDRCMKRVENSSDLCHCSEQDACQVLKGLDAENVYKGSGLTRSWLTDRPMFDPHLIGRGRPRKERHTLRRLQSVWAPICTRASRTRHVHDVDFAEVTGLS